MTSTQTSQIKHHLEMGRVITPIDALNLFGCFRLAARIHDLRATGMVIETKRIDGENGKSYAGYFLGAGS